jgi:predicted RNase H-like HicB family nuclease
MRFLLALHTDDGLTYGVTVPDLPGCFSGAESFAGALDNAREAIDAHVELLLSDGAAMPATRPVEEHFRNQDFAGAVWAVIEVPVERYFGPAEKINITVPALVLKHIDEYAGSHGESRSGFLVRAAQEAIRKAG